MKSKNRSGAACGVEPPPVETGLSVDDRPNKLNIAFWVISSVGALSPLLLHIIYVSVHATSLSLSFPLYLFLSFHAAPPPTKNTSLSLSLVLRVHSLLSLSLSLFISFLHSIFFQPPSLLPATSSPGISLSSFHLSHFFS